MNQEQKPPQIDLATANFKVKAVGVRIIMDLYDEAGRFVNTITTNEDVIPEARFFPGLAEFLATTDVKRGLPTPPIPSKA